MKLSEIRATPCTLTRAAAEAGLYEGCSGFHESLLRSHGIVQKVKELLRVETPAAVILEIIEDLENARNGEKLHDSPITLPAP